MAQWRSTSYHEHAPDSPNENWGPGSSRMTRLFDVQDGSFQGRTQAALDFLGYATVVASGNSNFPYYIARATPMPYPGFTGAQLTKPLFNNPNSNVTPPDMTSRFYAVGISRTEQLGVPTGINFAAQPGGTIPPGYTKARLTMEFSTLPYWIKEDSAVTNSFGFPDEGSALEKGWANTRYIIRHIEPFSRLIKIPYGVMWNYLVDPAKQLKVGIPFREGGANVTYTWVAVPLEGPVPGVNLSRIGTMLGTINEFTFDGFPFGTLLLDHFQTREYQGSFGERLADVTFSMIFLPHPSTGNANIIQGGGTYTPGTPLGWNYVYDVVPSLGGADYYPVSADQAGTQRTYRLTDFAGLFYP